MAHSIKPLALAVHHSLGVAGGLGLWLLLAPAAATAADAANGVPATAAADVAAEAPGAGTASGDAASAVPAEALAPTSRPAADAGKARQLQAVEVTAQRRKENLQKVPAAVSAISGTKLQDEGVGRAANDVVKYVPNASAATSGGHTRPRWWIRGVGTGTQGFDSPSPVGVYLDDVYISNASATGFPVFDLERVEVLRGPQGTLWGKNTTGGAINFVSRKPAFKSDGYARLDLASKGEVLIEGAAGGTVVPEKVAARASFHVQTRDGSVDNAYTGEDSGGFRDEASRLQFLAALTPDLEALLNVHVRNYRVDGNNATVIGRGPGGAYWTSGASYTPSSDPDVVSTNAETSTDIEQKGVNLALKWQLGKLELNSITAWEGFEQIALTDSDNTPLELSRGYSAGKTDQLSQEFRLASPRTDRWNWVAGLHYFTEDIEFDSAAATLPTAQKPTGRNNSFSNTVFTHETTSYALFGSTTFNVSDAFAVTAGLRWSTEEKTIDLTRWAATPPASVTFGDLTTWWRRDLVGATSIAPNAVQQASNDWSDWTYDLTPEWRFADNQRAYFHFARGFRGGSYNTSVNAQADVNVLNPEYLTSYELGYKSEWLDGQLNFNANVFHFIYEDMQINYVVPTPTGASSQLRNAAEGEANGAELEIEALPLANLHIKAGLGWLDTQFNNYVIPTGNFSGNRFVRSPEFSGVVNVEYRLPVASGEVVLGTDWNYYDQQFFYTNNQTDAQLWQDAYAVGNARLAYVTADQRLNVTVYANNLTDERFKQHTLPGTAGAFGNTVYWAEGLTGGVALTTRW